MRYLRLGCAVTALLASAVLHAQETSASLRGQVTNEAGAAVTNATVIVTHTPSGSRTTQTTDAAGSFNASGLRLGGPFSIEVTAPGFDPASAVVTGLTAGSAQRIEVIMAAQGQTITVTAARTSRSAISIASGPATVLNAEQIQGVASINRDIRDLARRDPLVTLDSTNSRAISIAGQNNRFNRITVDGVAFGDPFGLNNGGLASSRGPVPLDAIGEFSVEVAPADIQQGGFQGGAINTQLKSGTNEFHGAGFFTYADDGLAGSKTKPTAGNPTGVVNQIFNNRSYGGQITGPIIRDKLFFAVTYEGLRAKSPALVGPAGEGFSTQITALSRAQITQVQGIAKSVYNYDTLDVASSVPEKDDKLVAKVDWNIADGHRAALTYIYGKGTQLAGQTLQSTVNGTNPILSLQSNNYEASERNHYGVFQLNDSWTDVFSTQARVSYNDYLRGQMPYNGREFGQFTVCLDPTNPAAPVAGAAANGSSLTSCAPGRPQIAFGPDASRQANELRVKRLAIELQAQIKMGDHSVKIIAERRSEDFNNLFQQNVSGVFYFDSIADLTNRTAGSLTFAAPVNGDINSGAAIFKNINYTFGVQDIWDVTNTLTLIGGFRYDLYESSDTPVLNANFVARQGIPNNATLNGRGVFQPRLGFSWSPLDSLRLRGSAGRYAGGAPNVWIGNSYANTGTAINSINTLRNTSPAGCSNTFDTAFATASQLCAAGLNGVSGGTGIPSVFTRFVQQGLSQFAVTNAIDPNFKIPSQYRFAMSADYRFEGGIGDGFGIGGDVVYSVVDNGVSWTDLRSVANGVLPDGRPRYKQTPNKAGTGGTQLADNNQDVLLYNTKAGYSLNLVARATKDFDWGLSLGAAYVLQRSKDVSSGTSSVALSNYNQTASLDPNQSAYGISNYQIDNTVKLSVGFKREFFKDAPTRFDMFFESRAGQHYSYTFQDSTAGRSAVFGTTGTNSRYLVYVPNVASATADPLVSYATGFDFAGFQNFVQKGDLNGFQGKIAPKNIGRSPRFNKLDLHISQEVPLVAGFKVEVFGDIENVLNLINKDWGSLRQVAFSYYAPLVNVACNNGNTMGTPCTQYVYSNFRAPGLTSDNVSLWQIRLGARVKF